VRAGAAKLTLRDLVTSLRPRVAVASRRDCRGCPCAHGPRPGTADEARPGYGHCVSVALRARLRRRHARVSVAAIRLAVDRHRDHWRCTRAGLVARDCAPDCELVRPGPSPELDPRGAAPPGGRPRAVAGGGRGGGQGKGSAEGRHAARPRTNIRRRARVRSGRLTGRYAALLRIRWAVDAHG